MPSSDGSSPKDRRKIERGSRYEQQAAEFYEQQGYVILERNWRAGHKEIDLIVSKDSLIVFVEVKASLSEKFGHPVERVDRRKIDNLTGAAQQYIARAGLADVDFRFDVVTFQNGRLEHFPGAFDAGNEL